MRCFIQGRMKTAGFVILSQVLCALMVPTAMAAEDHLISESRDRQIAQFNLDHEMRSNYGLLDRNEETSYFKSFNEQKAGLLTEVFNHQTDATLQEMRSNIESNLGDTPAIRSVVFLASVYLFANGRTVKARLTPSTEVSASARAVERTGAVALKSKNISPLNLVSGIDYRLDANSQTVGASLEKEIIPHVTASVNQRRSYSPGNAPFSEYTQTLYFGTDF